MEKEIRRNTNKGEVLQSGGEVLVPPHDYEQTTYTETHPSGVGSIVRGGEKIMVASSKL